MTKFVRRLIAQYRAAVLPLLQKGVWAVADQALFAGANFLLNILLALWLTPVEYGAFTVVYASFILVGLMHTALLTEPMLVFGPERFWDEFPKYLRALMWGHSGFALLGGVLAAGAAAWFAYVGAEALASALLGLALGLPFMLFFWLTRMVPYVHRRPQRAALASAIYFGVLLAAAFAIHQYARVSAPVALLGMGGASLIAGLYVTSRFDVHLFSRIEKTFRRDIVGEHWKYGRWAVATGVLGWMPGNLYYLLLPAWEGIASSGVLKALMNLTMPITHAMAAFATLLVPELVKARGKAHGNDRFFRLIKLVLGLFLFCTVVYWLALGLFGELLIGWIYDGKYVEYAGLLWVLGGLAVTAALSATPAAALRALESPKWIFWANVCSSLVIPAVGFPLLIYLGIRGAAIGMVISSAVTGLCLMYFLYAHGHDLLSQRKEEEEVAFSDL